jgi:arylsulfatase A-like enzyme
MAVPLRVGVASVALALFCRVARITSTMLSSAAPNVVILLADDYGYGDPSPPLGVGLGLTPNLNAMAQAPGAAYFPRAYIGGSVCSPSRASILTGRSCTRDCVIGVETMALPLQLQGSTLGDVARAAGYATGFFGKYHLGSLSASLAPSSCYNASKSNGTCISGYVVQMAPVAPDTCCDGRDGHLALRTPLDFGFETVFATSQCAASSNSNCGCIETIAGAGENCNMGHYAGSAHYPSWVDGLECMGTYYTAAEGARELSAFPNVTDVDDAKQLVDRFEAFMERSLSDDRSFLATINFHQTHIPYVAPPAFRALYPDADPNEADYYGAATAMDAQVGRVRALLRAKGVENTTLVIFSSDNGPEVSPASGQGTTTFPNPGTTGGLTGRKRAVMEGGIRVPGIVEAPWLVAQAAAANRGGAGGGAAAVGGPLNLTSYATSHVDILPTVLELLNVSRAHPDWPLDGLSLVPALTGRATVREGPLGWLCAWPLSVDDAGADCPNATQNASLLPPSFPPADNFTLPGNQRQAAWMEGDSKLVGCLGADTKRWYWRLFDVAADAAEEKDLLQAQPETADAMFRRFSAWLASVASSRANESQCSNQP